MIKKITLPVILIAVLWVLLADPNIKEIAAGVAIFLFGMLFLEEGFKAFAGGILEKVLQKTTDKIHKSLLFGVVTTTVMQSSSLVSVITISFISAGLITLTAGIGIIFGANLGTTTGAWLVAGFGLKVKISAYAMPMLVLGLILSFNRSKYLKGAGSILAGMGFLFLGISFMKEGFEAFKEAIDLSQYAVGGIPGLLLFTLIGMIATVVMQSSHATLVLIITALSVGQITYENALALAIGANVGTTITAIIGSLSANIQGKRLALGHLIFNMATGLIAIFSIKLLVVAVDEVSASVGIAADDYALKLAVFHTIFNLIGVGVMYPFIRHLVDFLLKTLPEPKIDDKTVTVKYLNITSFEFPDTVLESLRKETWRMYGRSLKVMAHAMHLHKKQITDSENLAEVIRNEREVLDHDIEQEYELKIKGHYAAILDFMVEASGKVPGVFNEHIYKIKGACANIITAFKAIKHFKSNSTVYILSDKKVMHSFYAEMRIQIAEMMRLIMLLKQQERNSRDLSVLDTRLDKFAIFQSETMESINKMIVEKKITSTEAVSLQNDLDYCNLAITNLASSGKVLLGRMDFDVVDKAEQAAEVSIAG